MSLVFASVLESKKMLKNLEAWLEKGVTHAKAKSFDPNLLLGMRLAPDQYPLLRQIQSSCDNAKFLAARLSGKEAPKHPDTEQTMDECLARVRTCVSHLETYKASDFDGAETRVVTLPFREGKVLSGSDYLTEMAMPNLFFHLTTAYAILRHSGVALGKLDFLGAVNFRDK
ncbi:MAG TPA: DUF1993 domain-containing protein [Polyangiaceae bacterium]|jgi:hypothetical protein